MRDVMEIVAALQQPGVPRTATVHLRFSNGVAQQEKITALTLRDLQALALAWQEAKRLPPTAFGLVRNHHTGGSDDGQ